MATVEFVAVVVAVAEVKEMLAAGGPSGATIPIMIRSTPSVTYQQEPPGRGGYSPK
jgi:hypothetical protein